MFSDHDENGDPVYKLSKEYSTGRRKYHGCCDFPGCKFTGNDIGYVVRHYRFKHAGQSEHSKIPSPIQKNCNGKLKTTGTNCQKAKPGEPFEQIDSISCKYLRAKSIKEKFGILIGELNMVSIWIFPLL